MRRRQFSGLLSAALVTGYIGWSSGSEVADGADRWSGWRGNARDAILTDDQLPKSLDETSFVKQWEVSLDKSYSGPVTDGKRVFVTETRGAKNEVVTALDLTTGSKVWEASWEGSMTVPFFAKSNGDWIRSTPATNGEYLLVAGMRDVLVCLRNEDGKEVWRIDFPAKYGTPIPDFGFVCSPLIDGDHAIVQAGGGLVKINLASGEIVWKGLDDGGGMNGSAFSSPVVAEIHGRKQYLVQTRTKLCGVAADDGSILWQKEIEAFRGMNILTPTVWENKIFTSSYGGKSWLFSLEPTASKGSWNVQTLWEHKSQGYMSSPIILGSHLYMHLRNQRFICLDLATGKETWTTRPYGKYWSLIASDKRILALDEQGTLMLIENNPGEFKILSERKVSDEECWAHVAVSGNQVFVRHLKGLVAFQWK